MSKAEIWFLRCIHILLAIMSLVVSAAMIMAIIDAKSIVLGLLFGGLIILVNLIVVLSSVSTEQFIQQVK